MGQEEGIATVSTSVICSVVENRQAGGFLSPDLIFHEATLI